MSVNGAHNVAFEAFGVRFGVTADTPEVPDRLPALLPPGSRPCAPDALVESFGVLTEPDGSYQFTRGGDRVIDGIDLDLALILLESQLRTCVGLNAPSKIFVHAGVVAHDGRALVIPGLSFAGKTTLVLALVRAGATYYSDEYAVIDEEGLVHPYAKPLSVRNDEEVQDDHDVESLGGIAGDEPLRTGAVVFTTYRAGAAWKPAQLSPGRGVLAMLEHTLAALKRSEEAMRVLKRAVDGAILLEGERGEAPAVAEQLLAGTAW